MTTIILVRHGQTEWNRVERFRGRADICLNEHGFEQARQTAAWISKKYQPLAVFSSPLLRAMQTASEIAKPLNLEVTPSEGLNDIDYGKWQGLTPQEVHAEWPDLLDMWNKHPEKAQIPDGELLNKVQKRAMAAVMDLCCLYPQGEIVLVSHTVVNRLILLKVLLLDTDRFWNLHQDPCCINIIRWDGDDFFLDKLNCTNHF